MLGGLEAGGTKFVCLVGSGPEEIVAEARFPTGAPDPTLARAIDFYREFLDSGGQLRAIGVAAFGPIELRRSSPAYGSITRTPKPGWSGADLVGQIRSALGVPIGFDTDVNGAALAEGRWGAARGLDTFVYVTVGTGIGGGAVVGGNLAHGLVHPEMGHVSVPRLPGDEYAGHCPFHGACFEGMASGAAMTDRWGRPAEELAPDELHRAVELEAAYLAAGLRNVVYTLAPQRIVIGGGASRLPGLFPLVRKELAAELGGYPGLPERESDDFVVPAALGQMAGPAGALILAEQAAAYERLSATSQDRPSAGR
jgi:fructokinase